MNSISANQEATQHGYDEALLLDVDGFVAEGSGENIFIVRNGTLYEPELPPRWKGITRDSVHPPRGDFGLPFVAKRITRDEGVRRGRGLLHRDCCRGDADPRAGQPARSAAAAAVRSPRSCRRRSSTACSANPRSTASG
jgi:hypothetical protein